MIKKLRNRKYLKTIERIEVELSIIQGKIDYYEADLKINWDSPDVAIDSAIMLATYYNARVEKIQELLRIISKLK